MHLKQYSFEEWMPSICLTPQPDKYGSVVACKRENHVRTSLERLNVKRGVKSEE